MTKFDYETTIAVAREVFLAATEQVLQYNRLVDNALSLKIKGLSTKRLGYQTSPTFKSAAEGERWISLISAEITAVNDPLYAAAMAVESAENALAG